MRARLTQLREERANVFGQMKAINDKQETEKRDLTAEETQEYEKLEQRLDTAQGEITRLEREHDVEQRLAGVKPDEIDSGANGDGSRALPKDWGEFVAQRKESMTVASDEYRDAWFHLMSVGGRAEMLKPEHRDVLEKGVSEQRALSAIVGAEGGYTVPVTTYQQIVKRLLFFSPIRGLCTILATATGNPFKIPLEADIGTGGWEPENTAYNESDVVLGVATLNAFKFTRIIKIPKELIQDSVVDIEAYVANAFGRAFGLGEQQAYVKGTGVGQPNGFVNQAVAGTTIASAAALKADDIIDLMYSVSPPYRANGTFLANDQLIKQIRKFKDTVGRYLWEISLQAGQPDLLLGKPIIADPFLDAPGAAKDPIAFGDFSYLWLRDVAGITMQRLVELFAAQGQIGFLMDHRSDIVLTQTEAVKLLHETAA